MITEVTFEERYNLALSELEDTPLRTSSYLPLEHRILRRIGLRVRPPHYASFGSAVLSTGLFFAFGWGIIMWLILWRKDGATLAMALGLPILAGLIFGIIMALIYAYSAKKHQLFNWQELVEHDAP